MNSQHEDGVIRPGDNAPAFALPLLSGGKSELPDAGAKGLTLLAFFKNTCPTCRMIFPLLQRLHEQVAPSGGRVMGVSQDGQQGAAEFAREFNLTMPILLDGDDYPVSMAYGLVSVPTLYLVDSRGVIRRSGTGFSKSGLTQMADDLASSVGASYPQIYRASEALPDFKPG